MRRVRENTSVTSPWGHEKGQGQPSGVSREALAEVALNTHRALYERTGNGMHALDAYQRARKHGWVFPAWLLKYLDEAAEKLAAPGGTSAPEKIADAFALRKRGGGVTKRDRAKDDLRDLAIVSRIDIERYKHQAPPQSFKFPDDQGGQIVEQAPQVWKSTDDICLEVGVQYGLSFERVRNIYQEYRLLGE